MSWQRYTEAQCCIALNDYKGTTIFVFTMWKTYDGINTYQNLHLFPCDNPSLFYFECIIFDFWVLINILWLCIPEVWQICFSKCRFCIILIILKMLLSLKCMQIFKHVYCWKQEHTFCSWRAISFYLNYVFLAQLHWYYTINYVQFRSISLYRLPLYIYIWSIEMLNLAPCSCRICIGYNSCAICAKIQVRHEFGRCGWHKTSASNSW